MCCRILVLATLIIPTTLPAQTPTTRAPADGVILSFVRFADIFGGRLVAAFDSIPATRYDYRPTPAQQTIGYIAQHLEDANYSLCERMGDRKAPRTAKDSLADTIKARVAEGHARRATQGVAPVLRRCHGGDSTAQFGGPREHTARVRDRSGRTL